MTNSLWQPSATITTLKKRANFMARIRDFFNKRKYLEVETPIMARFGVTDVYLSNIKATCRGIAYNLQTSPEYHMKRLLAAGSGPIFQLSRVFRDDELGRWHNPEFTMLEWYQLNINHHQLMDEMDLFLQEMLGTTPMKRMTYQQAFMDICNLDPLTAEVVELRACLQRYDLLYVLPDDEMDRDQYLFLLMSHVVEPAFSDVPCPVAVFDFPPSQAALAQVHQGVAARFEVYFRGVELANGFHELTDAAIQRDRLLSDVESRRMMDLPDALPDEFLLNALESGMPACSGVALGIDRLLALALNQQSIADVLAFDFSRS